MKKKKTILNIIFLILCIGFTIYYVFRGQDFNELVTDIKGAKMQYWAPAIALVIVFILCESVIIYYLMRVHGKKPMLDHCFLYSFVGFFFSLITPSATGGQPMQIVFMKKDKLPVHLSTLVLLIITITYKTVLIIFGALILLIRPRSVMDFLEPVTGWIYLGMGLNVIFVGIMLALVFWPELMKKLVMAVFRLIKFFTRSSRLSMFEERLEKSMESYAASAFFFRKNKAVILNVMLITFFQRFCMFFITYLILLSFGITSTGMWEAVSLQAMISVAADMLPFPGGIGISEHLFSMIFLPICGSSLLTPVLIVSRGISFYTQLIISAVLTIAAYFIIIRGKENDRIL